ncbi:hypothetical protein FHU13_002938 [Methylobacterium sp. R2-1]|nr:hypothetical protein [Methylobacterium sp. R2-1]
MASTRAEWPGAVGIARNQKVYDPGVRLVEPGGRARKPVPD